MTHPNIEEFIKLVKTDGQIHIFENKIIKIKHKNKLTVDLKYDKENGIFLDDDGMVYFIKEYKNTSLQIMYIKTNQVPLTCYRPQFIQKRKTAESYENITNKKHKFIK